MRTALLACFTALALASFAGPVTAQERVTLGIGRLFTNDSLGDGEDRWRSAAYNFSLMRGPARTQGRPDSFGDLIEYRFTNRILSPSNTVTPAPSDRRYAGVMTAGAFSHFAKNGFDYAIGAELVAVGPMTRMFELQSAAHDFLGLGVPSAAVEAGQFPNAVYAALSFEAARPVAIGSGTVFRPFVQLRGGDEVYARVGADLLIGANFNAGVTVRDETTGLLYQTLEDAPSPGLSALIGADATAVIDSVWLPEPAYVRKDFYPRVRAGAHYQGKHLGLFYGATWTGPEFEAQPSGQVLGSLQVQLRF